MAYELMTDSEILDAKLDELDESVVMATLQERIQQHQHDELAKLTAGGRHELLHYLQFKIFMSYEEIAELCGTNMKKED